MTGSAGVDLSNNNTNVNFAALTGLDFVIAKASEGTTFKDPTYATYAEQTEKAGALFGAYHFFHAETLNAAAQARWFAECANPRNGLSMWVDYETWGNSAQQDSEEIALFITTLKVLYPKAKVGIYTNGTGLARFYPYRNEIPYNGLWFANPSIGMTQQSAIVKWDIHQYESLAGIDRDYCPNAQALWNEYWNWA